MLAIALALLAPLDDSTEAETLYRRMEAKLLAAQTLFVRGRILYEGDLHGEPEVRLRIMRRENLLRYDRRHPDEGAEDDGIISDGKRFLNRYRFATQPIIDVDLPNLGETSLVMFSRWGLYRGVGGPFWQEEQGKAFRRPVLKEFRLLHREEVGPRKTVAITYVQNDWASRATTLWIDEETLLPVQRLQREGGKCTHFTVTESYDEIRFDEAMPAERFSIPR